MRYCARPESTLSIAALLLVSLALSGCEGGASLSDNMDPEPSPTMPSNENELPDHLPDRLNIQYTAPGSEMNSALSTEIIKTAALTRANVPNDKHLAFSEQAADCSRNLLDGDIVLADRHKIINVRTLDGFKVGEPVSLVATICGGTQNSRLTFDASMPAHRHGMNYAPQITLIEEDGNHSIYAIENVLMHMPGQWSIKIGLRGEQSTGVFTYDLDLKQQ